jgi:hypothetical protein
LAPFGIQRRSGFSAVRDFALLAVRALRHLAPFGSSRRIPELP